MYDEYYFLQSNNVNQKAIIGWIRNAEKIILLFCLSKTLIFLLLQFQSFGINHLLIQHFYAIYKKFRKKCCWERKIVEGKLKRMEKITLLFHLRKMLVLNNFSYSPFLSLQSVQNPTSILEHNFGESFSILKF